MYLRGQKATATYILTNECNPYVSASSSYEIFNSISSVFGRSSFQLQKEPICVTGGTEGDYLGIDVDTFRLSTADDVNLNEHFPADATGFDLTLSVNQDAILANLLLVAVDTKNVDFEIPPEAIAWPQGREKHYCSCQTEEDLTDSWCEGKPLYFLIKVQNWGERDAENVIVTDELDENLDYVPGSTEMATQFDMDGKGTDWAQIPDKTGDGNAAFPLSGDGYLVADTMEPCNGKEYSCTDSRLIRFKAIPHMGLPANRIISNMAVIKEEGSAETLWYHTNGNIPLRLRKGVCGTTPLCPELTEEECGGTGPVGDDDSVIGADETASDDDATVADESASDDDATVADADTSKDGGCGCALVF
jgi:uncharacterized repeat protein (TIGR01451 family)